MRHQLLPFLLLLAGTLWAMGAHAQFGLDPEDQSPVSELEWSDQSDLDNKVSYVDNLTRRHFGRPLSGDKSDLELLQRIADRELIPQNEQENLQALGAVLGNVLRDELGLQWKVYQDEEGRNRALCVPNTEDCLFPITMLSRRLEVGLSVDVQAIYDDAVQEISPHLPYSHDYGEPNEAPSNGPEWITEESDNEDNIPVRPNQ